MEQINPQATWPFGNSDVSAEPVQEEVINVGLPLMSPVDEEFESQVQYIVETNVLDGTTTKTE